MLAEDTKANADDDPSADDAAAVESTRFQAQISDDYRLRLPAFLVVCLFCLLFLLLSYLPLRGTDLWLHVNYGDWILQHRTLPTGDPFVGLSEGMPYLDSSWLSQIIFAAVNKAGGPHALSALFAGCVFLAYLTVAIAIYRRTKSALMVLLLTILTLAVCWSRLATIRPENFAFLLFGCLLLTAYARPLDDSGKATSAAPSWIQWLVLPLILVLWSNLHASFPMGLAVIGCLAVGNWLAVSIGRRSLWSSLAERSCQHWIWLFQICLLATLINPYGIDLWFETFWFASRDNLQSILEWQPLIFVDVGGREYAISIVVMLIILRWSRRRMTPTEVLLLAVFAIIPLFGVRLLTWYGPVLALVLAPHLADCLAQIKQAWGIDTKEPATDGDSPAPPGVLAWKYSLLSLLAIWIAFSYSPISHPVLGTPLREPSVLYDHQSTPLGLTQYLKHNPPAGQTFHPHHWGDWLVRNGPAEMKVFATSNIHAVPRQVWNDYQRINRMQPGWQDALSRYNVTTWIADKEEQPTLKSLLRNSDDWQLTYEDDQSLVYVRQRDR